ncbi:MAG TPA: hypothetical protein VLB84_00230, partial [Bacteroidia bacterium]|nr:hypothetical protein [Bacteroidia bacterium]
MFIPKNIHELLDERIQFCESVLNNKNKIPASCQTNEMIVRSKLYEVVKVSEEKLLGEIIELHGDIAAIQVYEETAGIGPGDVVYRTGRTMSVALAPGLLESIYDGVQRPLQQIEAAAGNCFIKRGIEAEAIDMKKKWKFVPVVKVGDTVVEGDVLGEVQETTLIVHKVMVPPGEGGVIASIASGEFNVTEE